MENLKEIRQNENTYLFHLYKTLENVNLCLVFRKISHWLRVGVGVEECQKLYRDIEYVADDKYVNCLYGLLRLYAYFKSKSTIVQILI